MKISHEHLREPGLVVIDITAADEETAHQAAVALGGCGSPAAPQPRGARPAGPASPSAVRRSSSRSPGRRQLRSRRSLTRRFPLATDSGVASRSGPEASPQVVIDDASDDRALSGDGTSPAPPRYRRPPGAHQRRSGLSVSFRSDVPTEAGRWSEPRARPGRRVHRWATIPAT
ncbi:DUF6207 family protein [Streptomyces decoyicus]